MAVIYGAFGKASCFMGLTPGWEMQGDVDVLFVQGGHTHVYTKAQRCTNSSLGHKYHGKIAPRLQQAPKEA